MAGYNGPGTTFPVQELSPYEFKIQLYGTYCHITTGYVNYTQLAPHQVTIFKSIVCNSWPRIQSILQNILSVQCTSTDGINITCHANSLDELNKMFEHYRTNTNLSKELTEFFCHIGAAHALNINVNYFSVNVSIQNVILPMGQIYFMQYGDKPKQQFETPTNLMHNMQIVRTPPGFQMSNNSQLQQGPWNSVPVKMDEGHPLPTEGNVRHSEAQAVPKSTGPDNEPVHHDNIDNISKEKEMEINNSQLSSTKESSSAENQLKNKFTQASTEIYDKLSGPDNGQVTENQNMKGAEDKPLNKTRKGSEYQNSNNKNLNADKKEMYADKSKGSVHKQSCKAKGSVQNQPGKAKDSVQNQPGKAKVSVQIQPGKSKDSVQTQPGKAKGSVTNQPGKAKGSAQNQPGKATDSVQTQPGKTKGSDQKQQDKAKCSVQLDDTKLKGSNTDISTKKDGTPNDISKKSGTTDDNGAFVKSEQEHSYAGSSYEKSEEKTKCSVQLDDTKLKGSNTDISTKKDGTPNDISKKSGTTDDNGAFVKSEQEHSYAGSSYEKSEEKTECSQPEAGNGGTVFMLFIPRRFGQEVKEVKLMSSYDKLSNAPLEFDEELDNWKTQPIYIPMDIDKDPNYKYLVKFKAHVVTQIFSFGLKKTDKCEEYFDRECGIGLVKKDTFNYSDSHSGDEFNDAVEGLQHYILQILPDINAHNVKQHLVEFMTYDYLQIIRTGWFISKKFFIHWCCKNILQCTENVAVLFLTMLLCSALHSRDKFKCYENFNKSVAEKCLIAFRSCHSTMLPTDGQNLLSQLIEEFTWESYNSELCIFTLIHNFYPLLDAYQIRKKKVYCNETRLKQNQIQDAVLHIVRFLGKEEDAGSLLLEMFAKIKDITFMIEVHKTIALTQSETCTEMIRIINGIFVKQLKRFQSSSSLKGLHSLLFHVFDFEGMPDIKASIETQMKTITCSITSKCTDEEFECMCEIIKHECIFDTSDSILPVLRNIAKCQNDKARSNALITLLNDDKVAKLLHDDGELQYICSTALNTSFGFPILANPTMVETNYVYLNEMLDTNTLKDKNQVALKLKDTAKEWLLKIDCNKVMECACRLPDDMDKTIFQEHMQHLFKSSLQSKANNSSFCRYLSGLKFITLSHSTYGVIKMLLDDNLANSDSISPDVILIDSHDFMNDVLKNVAFWKTIFYLNGYQSRQLLAHRATQNILTVFRKLGLLIERSQLTYSLGMLICLHAKDKTTFENMDSVFAFSNHWKKGILEQSVKKVQDLCRQVKHEIADVQYAINHMKTLPTSLQQFSFCIEDIQQHCDFISLLNEKVVEDKRPLLSLVEEKGHFETKKDLYNKLIGMKDIFKIQTFVDFLKQKIMLQKSVLFEQRGIELSTIGVLFEDDEVQETEDNVISLNSMVIFACDECIPEYEHILQEFLYSSGEADIISVIAFFASRLTENELKQIESWCRKAIPTETRKALIYMKDFHKINEQANDLKRLGVVFGVNTEKDKDELSVAIESIIQMKMQLQVEENIKMNEKTQSVTIQDMYKQVSKVENAMEEISEDEWEVIHELCKAKTLIEFLMEIVDDDVRNLIDAVEEHSEQYVQESTVSDLIQVKKFLYPILHNQPKTVTNLIQRLKQCKTEKRKDVPSQISTCKSHLHSLKVLYNSVANRGEVTKDVVNNLLQRGVIKVGITCAESIVNIQCKRKKKIEVYAIDELKDLRSRALLISNTEKSDKVNETISVMQNMQTFISITDRIFEIWELVQDLHKRGHLNYQKFNWKTAVQSADEKLKELDSIKQQLSSDIQEWQSVLESVREKQYYMNFIHSDQIWILQDFFENGELKSRVKEVLQYISSEITNVEPLKLLYDQDYSQAENKLLRSLENLGGALDKVMASHIQTHLPFLNDQKFITVTKNIEAQVDHGKLYMAHNDAKNVQFVPTVLSLYMNTTQKFPKAHEILLCNDNTSWEEIQLLLNRCVCYNGDPGAYNLHVIVGIEQLAYELQNKLVTALHSITRLDNVPYLLAVVCKTSALHPIIIEFAKYVHRIPGISDEALRNCLQAACPSVYTITSDLPGIGKSEHVFQKASENDKGVYTVHVNGPLNKHGLAHLFSLSDDNKSFKHKILHINIGVVENSILLDEFVFEFIVLKCAVSGTKAAHLSISEVAIEVANTLNHKLRNDLFVTSCFTRKHLIWEDFNNYIVSQNIQNPMQIVCQYLNSLEHGTLGLKDVVLSGSNACSPLSATQCQRLLRNCLSSTTDISFSIARIYLNVLSQQLLKLSYSPYFKVGNLIAMMESKEQVSSVRTAMVEALVEISKEFACRSVHTCKSSQHLSITHSEQVNKDTEAMIKRVEGMIRWADSNHLLVVFHSQNIQAVTPLYRKLSVVPKHISQLFATQIGRKLDDFEKKKPEELQMVLRNIVCTSSSNISTRLGELASTYALTPDNLLKMVLIIMRIRVNIPVVLMGETGCGKTTLIRYLALTCGVTFKLLPLHAGVKNKEIVDEVLKINTEARKNCSKEIWLFLDEINTCNHLGLLNNILCHRQLNSVALAPNLRCLAACNPYRLRNKTNIFTSGLTGKTTVDQFSQLVYRVHPLPESLIDYVWDYGTLDAKDERIYIANMVSKLFEGRDCKFITKQKLINLLSTSQEFVREQENSDWCVSLRDIHRCCHLISWFLDMLKQKAAFPLSSSKKYNSHDEYSTTATILALALCYEVRLQDMHMRRKYWKQIADQIYGQNDKVSYIMDEVVRNEQLDILNRMEIEEGIAKNTALRENVFVIFVCMMNKIPIFLVGKPGCSKSLSMQLLKSNLRGLDSEDAYFQTLPQIYVVSYQGSESSTSEGIIKIFGKAERYRQQQKEHEQILPVVLLDEIGLAEISKYNPLKVLHSLLEPNTGTFPEVAVVGISNWALDAAKMNRAIHLSRPDLSEEELLDTGIAISTVYPHTILNQNAIPWTTVDVSTLAVLAKAYFCYHKNQPVANFHGLRDYYSLVKYISRELLRRETILREDVLSVIHNGLLRNFGGLPSEMNKIVDTFFCELESYERPHVSIEKLIYDNITDPTARHLMLITNGDSIIGEIGQILRKLGRENRIFYGSDFEDDQKEEYSYRMLSNIIYCMDNGIVLILKDLDEIYGSLYDMLNQNYTTVGKKKNCRIALGAHSNPMCHVHKDFRCIVLTEQRNIDLSDPPFLNRFEKQLLCFDDLLTSEEQMLSNIIQAWIEGFVKHTAFRIENSFLGYHDETVPSLIKAVNAVHADNTIEDILKSCKSKLLLTCTPDAVLRLPFSKFKDEPVECITEIHTEYFSQPLNDGILTALDNILDYRYSNDKHLKFVCFTRSNIHTDIRSIIESKDNVQIDSLSSFKSERQLANQVDAYFSSDTSSLLILQCSLASDVSHLLLAKLLIENKRNQYLSAEVGESRIKHVCILLHLDTRDSLDNTAKKQWQFDYADGWQLFTVDVLDYGHNISLEKKGIMKSILGQNQTDLLQIDFQPIQNCIVQNMLWAFSCILYSSMDRHPDSTKLIVDTISKRVDIIECLSEIILKHMKTSEDEITTNIMDTNHWQVQIACNVQMLSEGCSLVEAWRKYLEDIVKIPLARVVWFIEKLGAWNSIMNAEPDSWLSQVWKIEVEKQVTNNYHELDTVKPHGIMSMEVNTPPLMLKYPFSRLFLVKLQEIKTIFEEDLLNRQLTIESISELTTDDFLCEIGKYRTLVERKAQDVFPHIEESVSLQEAWSLIIEDFCNEYSWYQDTSLDESIRCIICLKFLNSRIDRLGKLPPITTLTAFLLTVTVENSRIWALMKLLTKCDTSVIEDIDNAIKVENKHTERNVEQFTPGSGEKFTQGNDDGNEEKLQDKNDKPSGKDFSQDHDEGSKEKLNNENDEVSGKKLTKENGEVSDENIEKDEAEMLSQDNYEGSVDNNNEESEETFIEDIITNIIVKSVIPFESKVAEIGGLQSWCESASALLSYCQKLGGECEGIHFIRFTFDLVNYFIEPNSLEDDVLYSFTKHACSEDGEVHLDSPAAFEYLTGIINNQIPVVDQNDWCLENSQRIICLYFARCLEYNPGTSLLKSMLNVLSHNELPKHNLDYIGPFVHCLLFDLEDQLEESIGSTVFQSFEDEEDSLCVLHNSLKGIEVSNDFFIFCADVIMSRIQNVAEHNANTEDWLSSEHSSFVEVTSAIAAGKCCGLNKLVGLAYCKLYIKAVSSIVKTMSPSNTDSLYQLIDGVLVQNNERLGINTPLYVWLLKNLMDGSVHDLYVQCKELQPILPALKTIEWPEDELTAGVGYNILSLASEYAEVVEALHQFPDKKNIEKVFKEAKGNISMRKSLAAAIATTCYWTKVIQGHRKDTQAELSDWVAGQASSFSKPMERLLCCVSGKTDFMTDIMNITTQHTFETVMQASFIYNLMSVVACTVTEKMVQSAGEGNIFAKCILNPKSILYCLVPQAVCSSKINNVQTKRMECRCQHCLITLEHLTECPLCDNKGIKMTNIKHYQASPTDKAITINQLLTSDCSLSSIVQNVIILLVEGCLVASYSLGLDTETINDKAYVCLKRNFKYRWTALQREFNMKSQELSLLLQKIIFDNGDVLTQSVSKTSNTFAEEVGRAITSGILEPNSRLVAFQANVINKCSDADPLMNELFGIESTIETRQTKKPSICHMLAYMQVTMQHNHTELEFLRLLLKWEAKLTLMKFLRPVLQWQLAVHRGINHKYTRQQAAKIDVHKLIFEDNEEVKEELDGYYKAFVSSLKQLESSEFADILEIAGIDKFPDINYKTPISECIVENDGHCIIRLMKALVWIQNIFLQEAAELGLQKHKALKFMCTGNVVAIPCKSVHQLNARDVIKFEWCDSLLRFSQNEVEINGGNGINYDFEQIEKELSNKLLLGKPYLTVPNHMFKTIYKNEMFHRCSHIFNEINEQIPQRDITSDMKNSIVQGTHENPESMRSTLDYLEVVISMLYKTGGNPEESIFSYAEKWNIVNKAITSKLIISQIKNYMTISHVVSLYEFMEDKLAYIALDAIPKEYCVPLQESVENELMKFINRGYVPVESVQTAIRRLISRYLCINDLTGKGSVSPLSPMNSLICQQPLWQQGVREDGVLTKYKGLNSGEMWRIEDVFPGVLFIEHTFAAYTLVTACIEKKKMETQNIVVENKTPTTRNRRKRSFFNN